MFFWLSNDLCVMQKVNYDITDHVLLQAKITMDKLSIGHTQLHAVYVCITRSYTLYIDHASDASHYFSASNAMFCWLEWNGLWLTKELVWVIKESKYVIEKQKCMKKELKWSGKSSFCKFTIPLLWYTLKGKGHKIAPSLISF